MKRTPRRGQGTVELALGAVVFIGVLLLGIHLAEISFLSLKTTEAAGFAVTEAEGARVHRFDVASVTAGGGDAERSFNFVVANAAPNATARYQDFDGRSSTSGKDVTQIATKAEALAVNCRATRSSEGVNFSVNGKGPEVGVLRGFYADKGGISCTASASVKAWNVPSVFLEGHGGLSKSPFVDPAPLKVCAFGKPSFGTCRGQLAALLGDWGLEGPVGAPQNKDVRLTCGRMARYTGAWQPFRPGATNLCRDDQLGPYLPARDNTPYAAMVEKLYRSHMSAESRLAAQRFSRAFTGIAPHDERRFFMSFSGEEHDYFDGVYEPAVGINGSMGGVPVEYRADYGSNRMACFLGLPGC